MALTAPPAATTLMGLLSQAFRALLPGPSRPLPSSTTDTFAAAAAASAARAAIMAASAVRQLPAALPPAVPIALTSLLQ